MTLLAETDWPTILTAGVTAFVTVAGTIGGGVAFLLRHLSTQRADQRAHEAALVGKVEGIARDFQDTAKSLAKDNRDESRRTVSVLLDIQKETVEAVGGLSHRVSELGVAIAALQQELHRKADRGDDLGSGEYRPVGR